MIYNSMVLYTCDRCNKNFKQKSQYDCHLNRKFPCKSASPDELALFNQFPLNSTLVGSEPDDPEIQLDIDEQPGEHICNYCKRTFSRNDSLGRHLARSCKIKKQQNDHKEELFRSMVHDLEEIKKQNTEMEKRHDDLLSEVNKIKAGGGQIVEADNSATTNITVQNNIKQMNQFNQQNNINIKMVAFRKEDLSHIKDEMFAKILNKGFKSIQNLVEYIHFDQNKPEHNNVYISNMRDKHVLIYDGEAWNLRERDEVLQQMIDDKTDILTEKFEELIKRIDEPTTRKFRRFLEQKDNEDVIADIKRDLKLILYNKRKITERTRHMIEAQNKSKKGATK